MPHPADPTIPIENSGGIPARLVTPYTYPVRPYGFPHPPDHTMHLVKPTTHLQQPLLDSTGGVVPSVAKGVLVSRNSKVAPPSSVSDCHGHKGTRDRSRDDSFAIIRDRKIKISNGNSLYAQLRSWMKNSVSEENQPQYMEEVKSLPKPLPLPVGDANSQVNKEDKREEEVNEEDVKHLSPKDLLQGHIKRAKMVRARLRRERLKRIARYKDRLALLLPPAVVEQQFKNDSASGN